MVGSWLTRVQEEAPAPVAPAGDDLDFSDLKKKKKKKEIPMDLVCFIGSDM